MGGFEPMDIEQNDTTYAQVRYKKKEGNITLTSDALTFQPSSTTDAATAAASTSTPTTPTTKTIIEWKDVQKHQVSPASYPKALLKLVLKSGGANITFQFSNRQELERIRKDITDRLKFIRGNSTSTAAGAGATATATATAVNGGSGKKRPLSELGSNGSKPATFGELDPTAVAVTRSSLLAANPALRQQHTYLVEESKTVSEEDFWKTHESLVEEEYARISGCAKAGTSSLLQSHLPSSGRVTLGVEEMRQIFILYPAVHKAYEEKVPLELSDEQFWRRYLESEYFHRDRGRIGTAARNHSSQEQQQRQLKQQENKKNKASGPSAEEQEARAAAVGTDDLFSRYDQKLKEQQQGEVSGGVAASAASDRHHNNFGRNLAVGQFDLASTFETERGKILEGPKDNHPPNQADDGEKGSRVIQKYNRHWAMVLHPDEAVAGANLTEVARQSVQDVIPDDPDAMAGGGGDDEMRKLVDFANATEEEADHAAGVGRHDEYEPLSLNNVEAYYTGQVNEQKNASETDDEAAKRHAFFSKAMSAKMDALVKSMDKTALPKSCFPPPTLGKELLSALTKKMAQDSQTEAASLEMVNKLPEDFRKKLQSYFRRSSELLRHFFGLRKLSETLGGGSTNAAHKQKLARIVRGMETFYREVEGFRNDLPAGTETGQMMRKMCLPIMEELDQAFKLHRERSGSGGGGGFVDVDETY